MLKRALRGLSVACALAMVASSAASAQLVNGKWQAPPQSGGSAGAAARQGTEVRHERDTTAVTRANNTVVPIRVIPAVLMSDGSIMADFGAGLEPVARACPHSALRSPLRIIAAGGSTQPVPELQPVPGMQAAPAQATASQQMASSTQSHTLSRAAQVSCHLPRSEERRV